MIAVDTNILVYAHRADAEHHVDALRAVRSLAGEGRPWAIPWPCFHEFLAIVTHPRVFRPPSSTDYALAAMADLIGLPDCTLLGETDRHPEVLSDLLRRSRVSGPRIHDARIAAICVAHGVDELWTADRDFAMFPDLRTRNPLV